MIRILALLAVVLALGGCATLNVELEQRPHQGALAGSISYSQADSSGTLFLRTVRASAVQTDRRLQAVKQGKYFWGLVDRAMTAPVEYDWTETPQARGLFSSIGSLLRSELNQTNYYTAQPIRMAVGDGTERMESRGEALARAGITKEALEKRTKWLNDDGDVARYPRVDKSQLSRLGADISPMYVPFFRLLTLGMFWDQGYSTDPEVFGLRNKSSVTSWFGRSEFMITMDSGGNFFVREFRFDPTQTVRNAAQLAVRSATLRLKAQAAGQLLASGQSAETLGVKDPELKQFLAALEAARGKEQAARDAANSARVSVHAANSGVGAVRKSGGRIAGEVDARRALVLGVIDGTLKTGKRPATPHGTVKSAAQFTPANLEDYTKVPELPK